MLKFNLRIQLLFLLLATLPATAGCRRGETLGKVSGLVTFQGKPVDIATVVFYNSEKGVYLRAQTQPDGTYEIRMAKGFGLPLGTYLVSVNPPPPEPTGPGLGPLPPEKPCPSIPKRYRDPKTSGLTLTVVEGENRLDIDMQP